SPLSIGVQHACALRAIDVVAVPKCCKKIVDETTSFVDITWVIRHHPRHTATLRKRDQLGGERCFIAADVLPLHFHSATMAKLSSPFTEQSSTLVHALCSQQLSQVS